MNKEAVYNLKKVKFDNDELLAIEEGGKIYVGVSYICRGIGFSKSQKDTQVQKVKSDTLLSIGCKKFQAGVFDDNNETLAIELDFLPMWLAKINITPTIIEENPILAENLLRYQLKAKDVLAEAFLKKPVIPQTYAEALLEAGRLALENERLELENKQKEQKLAEQKPLVTFAEQVSNSADYIDIGQLAKLAKDEHINIGRNKLFVWLRDKGYLMKNNEPYQKHIDNNTFKTIEQVYKTPYGEKINIKTLVSGIGQIRIINKLKEEFGSK